MDSNVNKLLSALKGYSGDYEAISGYFGGNGMNCRDFSNDMFIFFKDKSSLLSQRVYSQSFLTALYDIYFFQTKGENKWN